MALTLRTLCGLSTEQIARAFLAPVPTMARRLLRAKQKIRQAAIRHCVPPDDGPERPDAVMLAIYLVFNEPAPAQPLEPRLRRADLGTGYLGCLLGDRLATFRSPAPGVPPAHSR